MDEDADPTPPQPTLPAEAPPKSRTTSTPLDPAFETAAEPPPVTPADEDFQALIDRNTLGEALREARTQLSQLKVAYWLSRSGLDIKKHPKQIANDIAEKRRWIDTLIGMFREEGSVPEPAPEPEPVSKLEVVGGHLTNGVNTR